MFREALRSLLASKAGIEVVGEAASGAEAIQRAAALRPDVILMDVRMPNVDGVEATRRIHAAHPECRVLLLTTFDDDEYVFEGLAAGASGYLLKDADSADLLRAIRVVAQGESFLHPSIATRVIARLTQLADPSPVRMKHLPEPLTERELSILKLVSQGTTNREIAATLSLTEGTIKNQLSVIMSKLGARDRAHAAVIAKDLGLI
jgi:DNA-binding NarL/FixJ family response regulator